MKLSKILELHLHFAFHAPFVANVTIDAAGAVQLQVEVEVEVGASLHLAELATPAAL